MNIRFCTMTAHHDYQEDSHPQKVMKQLGITYSRAIPQSIADQWWFYDCKNVPVELPAFLTEMNKEIK